jgi:hypothetical protein
LLEQVFVARHQPALVHQQIGFETARKLKVDVAQCSRPLTVVTLPRTPLGRYGYTLRDGTAGPEAPESEASNSTMQTLSSTTSLNRNSPVNNSVSRLWRELLDAEGHEDQHHDPAQDRKQPIGTHPAFRDFEVL